MPEITPAPGLAFIRKIETAENYAGSSIVIPEQARDKVSASQYEIVSVGAPEPCDDEDCECHHDEGQQSLYGPSVADRSHPCYLVPSDWVLVRKRSAMATPDPELFVVRQADVLGRFREIAAPTVRQVTERPKRGRP